jgi:hypothetical protein
MDKCRVLRLRLEMSCLCATVFLSAGALEAIYEPAFAAMLSNVARLTELLASREYPGLKLTSHIFHDETHLSVIPATFSRGLRTVFNQRKACRETILEAA